MSDSWAHDAYAATHFKMGNAQLDQGNPGAAIGCFQQALQFRPDYAEAHLNLGVAFLKMQGQLGRAEASFRQALHCKPDYVDAHLNLGVVLRWQGRLAECLARYERALLLKPDHAEAHCNQAIVLSQLGKFDEAVAAAQRAVRLKPDYADACMNLAGFLKELGRLDDALSAYRTALQLRPDAAYIHSNLIVTLHYHPQYDAAAVFKECQRFNQQHAEPLRRLLLPHVNSPDPDRRLRVGYVSPHFGEHVDSFFTVPLLSHHDHRQFEIFCYADVVRPGGLTERLRSYADVWRSTVGLSDQQLADLIRSDRIDILVDLKLHTADNRLLMFARKPAPVQVSWLGCTGTTGLSTIDYRLTDPYLDPPALFDGCYSEESIRLPDSFWCYDPLADQPSVNSLPALKNTVVTFGCLNNLCKVNDGCLTLWAKVLENVAGSRLIMLAPQGQVREQVLERFEQEGVARSRVVFVVRQSRSEYLKQYLQIDLSLDTMPCSGHTTSLDAFWMGVPTVTLVSEKTPFGRATWSQLCNLGLKELAARTPEQYVALATNLAMDLKRLTELRGTLRPRMLQSPLMDAKRFASNMEQAYRQIWRKWCREK